ncbi:MAG: hypothetical protein JXC33_07905 [Deltaproteobacteria bacterium]|nr:hypothetical protein [Deltaproteobacteria bacterium]
MELIIRGKMEKQYEQFTQKGKRYLVSEFHGSGKAGQTIIQRVKDFECRKEKEGKEMEMPVFVSAFVSGGAARFNYVRVPANGNGGSRGGSDI